jgi:hypothetical protein
MSWPQRHPAQPQAFNPMYRRKCDDSRRQRLLAAFLEARITAGVLGHKEEPKMPGHQDNRQPECAAKYAYDCLTSRKNGEHG